VRHLAGAALAIVVLAACAADTTELEGSPSTTTEAAPGAGATTAALAGVDAVLGIVPPEPNEVPFVQDSWDHLRYFKRCMDAAGYAVELIPGGNPAAASDHPSTPRSNEVSERCLRTLPQERGWVVPTPFDGSEAGNRLLYEIQMEIHSCLVEHGYPTVDPPTEQAFIEEGATLWHPFDAMIGSELTVHPDADPGPSGSVPPMVTLQLEAQDQCGASPAEVYAQRLRDGDG